MQRNYKYNLLFTFFPCHQVSVFTHMHSLRVFNAFRTAHVTPVTSQQDASHHGYNARAGECDLCWPLSSKLWRRQPFTAYEVALALDKIGRKGGKIEILWVHIYSTTPSRAKFGSKMCIFISSIQTFIFIRFL
jgi:hypothetical protein